MVQNLKGIKHYRVKSMRAIVRAGSMAKVVDCLLSKHGALNSNLTTVTTTTKSYCQIISFHLSSSLKPTSINKFFVFLWRYSIVLAIK
jgi:hypothetical protein